jgi:hypothetical protein
MTRHKVAFGALVLTQAAHSVEEYVGRLWETFPPARFLTGLVSRDQEQGFLLMNVALVAFGVLCGRSVETGRPQPCLPGCG